jgi:5-methylcytosine-specific restriction endonuclease McrA
MDTAQSIDQFDDSIGKPGSYSELGFVNRGGLTDHEARSIQLWRRLEREGLQASLLLRIAAASVDAARQRRWAHNPVAVRKGFDANPELRRRILQRDLDTCQWCGKAEPSMHVDHIVPIKFGGSNSPANLQTLCPSCNWKKGATCEVIDILITALRKRRRGESIDVRKLRKDIKTYGKALNRNPSTEMLIISIVPMVIEKVVLRAGKKGWEIVVDKLVDDAEEQQAKISLDELQRQRQEWQDHEPHVRGEILKRDDYRCWECGVTDGPFTVLHRVPLHRGGTNERTNLYTVCQACSRKRRRELLRLYRPRVPSVQLRLPRWHKERLEISPVNAEAERLTSGNGTRETGSGLELEFDPAHGGHLTVTRAGQALPNYR